MFQIHMEIAKIMKIMAFNVVRVKTVSDISPSGRMVR